MTAAELVVEVDTSPAEAEIVADRLWQHGATAVELRDGGEGSTTVVASFPTPAACSEVAAALGDLGARTVQVDPSWRDAWRRYAQPVEVGRGLLVAPAWRDVPVGSGRLVVRMDPGESFGSGSHPSTRLILAALDRRPPEAHDFVLDVGCGSGILAVAAARLGAASVTAVDIDPAAVATTRANAEANGVGDRVVASSTPVSVVAGRFDVVLVNVTAAVHAELGPAVTAHTREGGRILLAGLLPGQWQHVAGAYAGATVTASTSLDGWEGVELVRGG
ncbi:MAG TPA: 50S ribosomal protein L11 methyltransferase [Acidimicrobiales bacterium]|nr:50S ribosomal protein L11 methyltransferase [Acidimicrobiales bacterium]